MTHHDSAEDVREVLASLHPARYSHGPTQEAKRPALEVDRAETRRNTNRASARDQSRTHGRTAAAAAPTSTTHEPTCHDEAAAPIRLYDRKSRSQKTVTIGLGVSGTGT